MQLDKLTHDADAMIGALEPGLANFDFRALNQTLNNASRTLHEADDVLFELKQYPSGFILGQPPIPIKNVQPPARQ
jgi:hypothetical protein